jgi:NAD dependent epimerase/dehydratase family enzyme
MKVVIPGGSGQVGTILARAFQKDGHDVVVLSRRPDARPWRVIPWDGAALGNWQSEIDGCDVVINLTGRSVNCRYNRRSSKGDPAVARVVDARSWTGDRDGSPQATRVATSQYRHDLCASIRQP